MEYQEERSETTATTNELLERLSEKQRNTIHNLELQGWQCKFIRRPQFHRPVCIVSNPENTQLAVIEEDGTLNKKLDIPLRSADN